MTDHKRLGIVGVGRALVAYILRHVAAKLSSRTRDVGGAGLAREAEVARAGRGVARARQRRGVGAARDAGARVLCGLLPVDGAGGARGTICLVKQGVECTDGARVARAADTVLREKPRWAKTVPHLNAALRQPRAVSHARHRHHRLHRAVRVDGARRARLVADVALE